MHGMHTVVELLCRRNRLLGSRSSRTDALVLRTVLLEWNGGRPCGLLFFEDHHIPFPPYRSSL